MGGQGEAGMGGEGVAGATRSQRSSRLGDQVVPIPQTNGVRQGSPDSSILFGRVIADDLEAALRSTSHLLPSARDQHNHSRGDLIWTTHTFVAMSVVPVVMLALRTRWIACWTLPRLASSLSKGRALIGSMAYPLRRPGTKRSSALSCTSRRLRTSLAAWSVWSAA